MSTLAVEIRPARDEDRADILRFTQDTFSWGDYIGQVFAEWVQDVEGAFFVAAVPGRAVGCLHVSFQGEAEAWHEGMRIDPEFRRQRIASRLDEVGREAARARGCRVVRLATGLNNHAAQKTISSEGYHPLFLYHTFETDLEGVGEGLVPAPLAAQDQADELFLRWTESEECRLSGGIAMLRNWKWGRLTPERLSRLVTQDCIRRAGPAFWLAEVDEAEAAYSAAMIVSPPSEPAAAVAAVLGDARAHGCKTTEVFTPAGSKLARVLPALGFRPSGGLYIYQYDL